MCGSLSSVINSVGKLVLLGAPQALTSDRAVNGKAAPSPPARAQHRGAVAMATRAASSTVARREDFDVCREDLPAPLHVQLHDDANASYSSRASSGCAAPFGPHGRWQRSESDPWDDSDVKAIRYNSSETSSCWWWKREKKQCHPNDEAEARLWEWVMPPACRQYNKRLTLDSLCATTRRRHALFLGDSLTRQSFYALLQELHAAGGWRPTKKECGEPENGDRANPCARLRCPARDGGGDLRLCYRTAYHLWGAQPAMTLRTSYRVAQPNTGGLSRTPQVSTHTCCHHTSGVMGAAEAALPHPGDVDGWRRVLRGVDALMLGAGMHWAGQPACSLTQSYPELRTQIDAAFNRTIATVVSTVRRAAPTTMALWWRSQPAGYRRCSHVSARAASYSAPIASFSEQTRVCGGSLFDPGRGGEIALDSNERAELRHKLVGIQALVHAEKAVMKRALRRQNISGGVRGAAGSAEATVDARPSSTTSDGNTTSAAFSAATLLSAGVGVSATQGAPLPVPPPHPAPLRDPFCWDHLPRLDAMAAWHVLAAGGHHLRADRPGLLRLDAYRVRTPNQNATDCVHTCLGATPRLYALAVARFVLAA